MSPGDLVWFDAFRHQLKKQKDGIVVSDYSQLAVVISQLDCELFEVYVRSKVLTADITMLAPVEG